MAKNKLELSTLPNKELVERYKEEKNLYLKLKFSDAVAKIENPNSIKVAKKNVARYLTELNARRIKAESEKINNNN